MILYLDYGGIYTTVYSYCREGNGTPLQHSCLENPMDGHPLHARQRHTLGLSYCIVQGELVWPY